MFCNIMESGNRAVFRVEGRSPFPLHFGGKGGDRKMDFLKELILVVVQAGVNLSILSQKTPTSISGR